MEHPEPEIFLDQIMENLLEGVVVVDSKGVIQTVNPAMERISGYSREELLGQSCALIRCAECFAPSPNIPRERCQLFQHGAIAASRCVLARKDGSLIHVLKQGVLLRGEGQQVLGGVEIFLDISELVAQERLISSLRREFRQEEGFQGMLGKSPAMQNLFALLRSVAPSPGPVMIFGESGTGKEMVARALHRLSPRAQGPFITVNCRALPEPLLERELFGTAAGAGTTGALSRGQFEAARGGDLFLVEVGELPLGLQARLLRILEAPGRKAAEGAASIFPDVRLITATSQNLPHLMAEGRFLEELFYRLNVMPIQVPPLRERREDIPLLASAFIERARLKTKKPVTGLSPETLELLMDYHWPGNVRELLNAMDYAVVLCPSGNIQPEHLPPHLHFPSVAADRARVSSRKRVAPRMRDQETLMRALREAGGKVGAAAQLLGISRVTLWKWLKRYNISADDIPARERGTFGQER